MEILSQYMSNFSLRDNNQRDIPSPSRRSLLKGLLLGASVGLADASLPRGALAQLPEGVSPAFEPKPSSLWEKLRDPYAQLNAGMFVSGVSGVLYSLMRLKPTMNAPVVDDAARTKKVKTVE